tara:strand:- start:525 stop:1325 length:801 start_codon:yes stop_codon:yes gene_type:complete
MKSNSFGNLSRPLEDKECRRVVPNCYGWLEYDLNQEELDYVWRCVENKRESWNHELAGNISNSYILEDKDEWFYKNVLQNLVLTYSDTFDNLGKHVPITNLYPYTLSNWWVNYQKKYEFQPPHTHNGLYSFVIWLKIPSSFEEENKGADNNNPLKNCFQFSYMTILNGTSGVYTYRLSEKNEGTMLLFPSNLTHSVFPFYKSDEDRISISGNICLNTEAKNYDECMSEMNESKIDEPKIEDRNPWKNVEKTKKNVEKPRIVKEIWM